MLSLHCILIRRHVCKQEALLSTTFVFNLEFDRQKQRHLQPKHSHQHPDNLSAHVRGLRIPNKDREHIRYSISWLCVRWWSLQNQGLSAPVDFFSRNINEQGIRIDVGGTMTERDLLFGQGVA